MFASAALLDANLHYSLEHTSSTLNQASHPSDNTFRLKSRLKRSTCAFGAASVAYRTDLCWK